MEIIEFQKKYAQHFDLINRDWIEKYFKVEPIDNLVLKNPVEKIIRPGGAILFAKIGNEILGTVALKKHTKELAELTKMGVYESGRNKGIGRLLILAVLDKARSMGFSKVVLYSNRKLENAIHLYRKMGFEEIEISNDLYERCDIQMELKLNQ